jgi:glycosyltransferase involved in cell wall biosynthesis
VAGVKQSICFVVTTPFAVNAFLRTHLLALSQVYEVTLCVNTTAYPLDPAIGRAIRVRHVDIERKIAPFLDLLALWQLIHIFGDICPSVVHSMTPKAGLLAMLTAYLVGVPWRIHTFTGQVWANKSGAPRILMKTVDRLITLCSNKVFADSTSQCRFLEENNVGKRGSVQVLGKGSVAGVNLSRFNPNPGARIKLRRDLGVSNKDLVFIFVGRLVRDKGVYDLVNAFSLVNAYHPQWRLWMVGPDEDGIRVELEKCALELGARVSWFGPTPTPEDYLRASDIFVLPSFREGFGSVIIEAAACGVPSVAYRTEGVVDAIIDLQTGLLVDKGDIQALASAMQHLGADECLRLQLGEAARLRASNVFSSIGVTAAWQTFYSGLLQS